MVGISRSVIILALSSSIVFAQQPGTASKGGSFRVEKAEPRRHENLETMAATYRPIVRLLDLNFTELMDEYHEARKDNSGLKFESVITAYIATEQCSASSGTDYGKAVVQALKPAHNNLAVALQRVFSLTKEQAKVQAREAAERYKQAERQVRQP